MFSCYIHMCLCCCGSESHSWPWSRPGGQLFPRSDMVFFWLLTIPCACWPLTSGLWYFLKEHPPQLQHELTAVISPNLSYTYAFNHGPSKKIRFCSVPFSSLSTAENLKEKKPNFHCLNLWSGEKINYEKLCITTMFSTPHPQFSVLVIQQVMQSNGIGIDRPHLGGTHTSGYVQFSLILWIIKGHLAQIAPELCPLLR